jgi:hypothetical protein
MFRRFVETAFCDTVSLTFGDVRRDRRVNPKAGPRERAAYKPERRA